MRAADDAASRDKESQVLSTHSSAACGNVQETLAARGTAMRWSLVLMGVTSHPGAAS